MYENWFELDNINFAAMSQEEMCLFLSNLKTAYDKFNSGKIKIVKAIEKIKVPAYLSKKFEIHDACVNSHEIEKDRIFLCVETENKFLRDLVPVYLWSNLHINGREVFPEDVDDFLRMKKNASASSYTKNTWIDIPKNRDIFGYESGCTLMEMELTPLSHDENISHIKHLLAHKKDEKKNKKYIDAVIQHKMSYYRASLTVTVDKGDKESSDKLIKTIADGLKTKKGDEIISSTRCAKFIPFTCIESFDVKGFCYGKNQMSDKPIFIDRREAELSTAWITGVPETAKETIIENEIVQVHDTTNDDIICVDFEDFMQRSLIRKGFGSYLLSINPFFGKDGEYHINALDYIDDGNDEMEYICNTTLFIVGDFLGRQLTDKETADIENAVKTVFEPFVETLRDRGLKYCFEENPTIADVINKYESAAQTNDEIVMRIGVNGDCRAYLEKISFKTQMPVSEHYLSVSLPYSITESKFSNIYYMTTLSYINNRIRRYKIDADAPFKKLWVYLNYADNLIEHSRMTYALNAIIKSSKSDDNRGVISFVTDALSHSSTSNIYDIDILDKIGYWFICAQSFLGRHYVSQLFNFSEPVLKYIEPHMLIGRGLIVSKGNFIPFEMKNDEGAITYKELVQIRAVRRGKKY